MRPDCPSDDVLAAHVVGQLTEVARDRVGAHLDDCDSCRAVIIALARGTPRDGTDDLVSPTASVRSVRAAAADSSIVELPARFRVDRLLGQGGMGRVFAAHDTELDRPVAVKIMRPDLGSAGLTDRLLRESRLMARVSDPAVVTVYDVGRHGDHVFIAMEYIAGVTLSAWLRDKRRSRREIVDVFRRAGQGLAAAHKAGLVHRDVKPENILLALEGDEIRRVAVTDFGVARAVLDAPADEATPARPGDVTLTVTGVAVGTPAYMAPEQLDVGSVDHRADVFAFAVALWEALYGERPYRGRSPAEIREAMRGGPPEAPAPRWLGRAIRAAIDPDLERRTSTMTELLAAIDPGRRDRALRLGGAGIGCLAIAALAFAAWPRARHETLPALCGDAGLADVWNEVARAKLRSAVTNLPGDVARSVAERAVAATDAYAKRWEDVRVAVCHRESPEPLQRPAGAACLSSRRSALGKVIELAPAMKPVDLFDLDNVIASLSSPAVCQTDAAKLLLRDVDDPVRVVALQSQLAEINAIISTSDHVQARDRLAALGPSIDAAHSRSLTADYLFTRWRALKDAQPEQEIDLLRAAAIAADAAGRSDLSAVSWTQLADVYSQSKNDSTRANEALGLADSAITRGGDDPSLRAQLQLVRAHVLAFDGKLDDAQQSLDDLRLHGAKDAPQLMPDIEESEIGLLRDRGKLDDALALAKTVLVERTQRLGPSHRSTATIHSLIADILIGQGDVAGTLAETHQVVELAAAGYGAESDWMGLALRNESVALSAVGKTDDAITDARRARAILTATRGAKSFMVGNTYETEATALAEGGRHAEAVPLFQRALEIYETAVGGTHLQTAECGLSLGTSLAQIGRAGEAIEADRKAVESFRATYGEDNPHYAYARGALGELYIHLGRKDLARTELEAAVAIYDKVEFDPEVVWTSKFNLAQAIVEVSGQRARAVALARDALTFYQTSGRSDPSVAAGITKWLASYGGVRVRGQDAPRDRVDPR